MYSVSTVFRRTVSGMIYMKILKKGGGGSREKGEGGNEIHAPCACDIDTNNTTVIKELRLKMFGQHPGYFKAVFLKQTRIIIVSIYKYTVYIMF